MAQVSLERPYDPKAVAQWFVARGRAVIAPSGRGGSQGVDEEGVSCSEAEAAKSTDRTLPDVCNGSVPDITNGERNACYKSKPTSRICRPDVC